MSHSKASHQAKFVKGDLTKHIITMSLTSAIGFAGTILFMTTSISIGMAIAGGAMVAKSLGENKPEVATELLTHVLIIGVVFAAFFASVIYLNLYGLTDLIGATGNTQELAVSYLKILIPSMPIMLIGIVASAVLRSHGAARLSMVVILVAGVVNAIFDPIFIFILKMGLDGAAWASVVSRIAMAVVAVWYIVRRYEGFSGLSFMAIKRDLKPISAIAIPAMLANIAAPVGGAYVIKVAAEFGESAVAGIAIIGRVTPVAFALIFAMSGAIGPIIGQNFGAGQHRRVRQAFNRSMVLIVMYVIPVVVVLYFLRGAIANVFDANGLARDLIFLFCGPLSLAWIFNGVIFIGNAAYNNLGHPFYSTWINWGRNTLGIIPFVYFGAQNWGAQGVLIGQMAGGVFVAIVSFFLAQRLMKKVAKNQILGPVQPSFGTHLRSFKITHMRQ